MPEPPAARQSRTEISLRVKGIMADQLLCHANALPDHAEISRLDRMDSLRALRLLIAVEESLDVSILLDDLAEVKTVGQFIDVVEGAVLAREVIA